MDKWKRIGIDDLIRLVIELQVRITCGYSFTGEHIVTTQLTNLETLRYPVLHVLNILGFLLASASPDGDAIADG